MDNTCKHVSCGCGIVTRMALSLEVCKQMHLKATSYLPSLVVNKGCVDCVVIPVALSILGTVCESV